MRLLSTVFLCLVVLVCGCGGPGNANTPPAAAASAANETPPKVTKAAAVPQSLFDSVERNPNDPAARRALGIALHGAKRRNEAVEQFEKLVELDASRRHLLDLALAYQSVSELPEAIATYERILAMSPNDAIALHNMGNIALRSGDAPGAAALYRRAIASKPDYLLAYYHLGNAYLAAEQFREAFGSYEQALAIEPKSPAEVEAQDDSLYQLGALDLKMGAHERAMTWLRELLELNPEHPRAHYAYAQALIQTGREEEAERELEIHAELMSRRKPTGPVATGD
jgi:tetratricopeptide (TPR) repeat protein